MCDGPRVAAILMELQGNGDMRQGCDVSPSLFNVYERRENEDESEVFGGGVREEITWPLYANDLIVCGE